MPVYGGFALTLVQDYLSGKTLKVLLVKSTYQGDQDTERFLADLPAGAEIAGGSYPAGGQALTNVTATYDLTRNLVIVDADDVVFTDLDSPDVGGAVYYADSGSAATSRLLGFDPYPVPIDATGASLTHEISPDGILSLLCPEA